MVPKPEADGYKNGKYCTPKPGLKHSVLGMRPRDSTVEIWPRAGDAAALSATPPQRPASAEISLTDTLALREFSAQICFLVKREEGGWLTL